MGSFAALSCFISRLAERALPFFKLLRRSGSFTWTKEAEQAFQELKKHLTFLSMLVAPELGETLFLYLAASTEVVSMVMFAQRMVQAGQGVARDPPAEDGGPTTMEAAGEPMPGGPDLETRGPDKPQPGEKPEALGAKGPAAPEPGMAGKGMPDLAAGVRTI